MEGADGRVCGAGSAARCEESDVCCSRDSSFNTTSGSWLLTPPLRPWALLTPLHPPPLRSPPLPAQLAPLLLISW